MKNTYKKIIVIVLLASMLLVSCPPSARADFWGAEMAGEIWKQTTEQMVKSIQDTILANLKIAALRIIQARLMSLLGSNKSTTPGVTNFIISDWKVFIYSSAMKYSNQVTNDFFRGVNAGATSAMRQYVTGPAERAVNTDYWSMRPDLQNYCPGGDPTKAFSAGTSNQWKCWQMSGAPQNDLAFTALRAASYKQAAYDQEVGAKKSEGQAGSGVVGKESPPKQGPTSQAMASNGNFVTVPSGSDYKGQSIDTPGSMLAYMMNEINMAPAKMLTLARSIPEVATAMVNQMLSQIIQQGVTKMISPSGSGGSSGMSGSSMNNQMMNQAQGLIQGGVRSVASPNMFFGGR